MDVRNGHIYTAEQVAAMPPADREFLRPMQVDPTGAQLQRGRVGRNDPCPCGSGKKFKACCLLHMGGPRRNQEQEREYAEANELGIPVFDFRMRKRLGLVAPKVIPPAEVTSVSQQSD